MHIVLVTPEIAQNSGNIIRLCANTGAQLHLVEPLGFSMESSLLKRAGLDYHDMAQVQVHASIDDCLIAVGGGRRFALRSQASTGYHQVSFRPDDVLIFGSESSGLRPEQLSALEPLEGLRIPMRPQNRSLNVANAVAVVVFEAWRQQGFPGSADYGDPALGQGQTAESFTGAPFDR